MVWNLDIKKQISSRHAEGATTGRRPPLDVDAFDFSFCPDVPAATMAAAPRFRFNPAYTNIFLTYLASGFPSDQAPIWQPVACTPLPLEPKTSRPSAPHYRPRLLQSTNRLG